MSASTKPPLSAGKARTETTLHKPTKKKPASYLPSAKHKAIHRSSSYSEQDESRTNSRDSRSDSKLRRDVEVGSSNSAIINRMEREINVSILVEANGGHLHMHCNNML